jgi:hypothetical protein
MRGIDCAHSRTLKMLPWPWFREGIGVLKRKSNIFGFLWENRRFLGFSRWEIDCAHSRSMKTLLWPWFREIGVLKRKSNIFGFLWENRRFLGFYRREIDCAHSQTLKTLTWPWFREGISVLKRKSESAMFWFFSLNQIPHSRSMKTYFWPGSGYPSLSIPFLPPPPPSHILMKLIQIYV